MGDSRVRSEQAPGAVATSSPPPPIPTVSDPRDKAEGGCLQSLKPSLREVCWGLGARGEW